jgi:hypothetical protein
MADRKAVLIMQQALLPAKDLLIPQVDMGWCYRPGGVDDAPVGGSALRKSVRNHGERLVQ